MTRTLQEKMLSLAMPVFDYWATRTPLNDTTNTIEDRMYAILETIEGAEKTTREIAEELNISKPTTNQYINGMIKAGIPIKRIEQEHPGTPAGRMPLLYSIKMRRLGKGAKRLKMRDSIVSIRAGRSRQNA